MAFRSLYHFSLLSGRGIARIQGRASLSNLLDFLNLRAQATESTITDESSNRFKQDTPHANKGLPTGGMVLPSGLCVCANQMSTHCMLVRDLRTYLRSRRLDRMACKLFCIESFVKQCKSVHSVAKGRITSCCTWTVHPSLPITFNSAAPPFTPQNDEHASE